MKNYLLTHIENFEREVVMLNNIDISKCEFTLGISSLLGELSIDVDLDGDFDGENYIGSYDFDYECLINNSLDRKEQEDIICDLFNLYFTRKFNSLNNIIAFVKSNFNK